jgi:signal transduction histidine kinase
VVTVKSQLDEDSQIHISIHDTGPGLPLGNADQIFDTFFTTKPQGSGMGLAISKSVIESHGGRIWANGVPVVRSSRPEATRNLSNARSCGTTD